MEPAQDFDAAVQIALRRDEAIVLQWYLTRELWRRDPGGLQASFAHPAEAHCLEALIQELIPPLMDTGSPDADAIHEAALQHLAGRHR